MRYYLAFPVLMLLAAVQSSVLPQAMLYINALTPNLLFDSAIPLEPFLGNPNLVFLAVFSWSVHGELEEGLFWAFVGGIAQDLLSLAPLGTSVVGMMSMAFVLYLARQQFIRVGLLLMVLLMLLGTVLQELSVLAILSLQGWGIALTTFIPAFLFPVLLYHLVLFLPIYGLIRLFQHRLPTDTTMV